MGIVERIKEKATEKNKSIRAIEAECGLSIATIGRWNRNLPTIEKVEKVANLLQVSLDWLITGKEPEELTQDEKHIIDLYRAADERGKRHIEQCAQAEAQEQRSSDWKTG